MTSPNRQLPVIYVHFESDGTFVSASDRKEWAELSKVQLGNENDDYVTYPPPTQLREVWRLLEATDTFLRDDTELVAAPDGWVVIPEDWIGRAVSSVRHSGVIRRRETIAQTTNFSPWRPIAELDLNSTPRPVLIVARECWPVIYWVPDRGDGTIHHELSREPTHFCELPSDPWDSDETIAQTEPARCETCDSFIRGPY